MAKKSKIQHNLKRIRMIEQYAPKREALKAIMADPDVSDEDFYAAQKKLTKLPRNSSPISGTQSLFRNRTSSRLYP